MIVDIVNVKFYLLLYNNLIFLKNFIDKITKKHKLNNKNLESAIIFAFGDPAENDIN